KIGVLVAGQQVTDQRGVAVIATPRAFAPDDLSRLRRDHRPSLNDNEKAPALPNAFSVALTDDERLDPVDAAVLGQFPLLAGPIGGVEPATKLAGVIGVMGRIHDLPVGLVVAR